MKYRSNSGSSIALKLLVLPVIVVAAAFAWKVLLPKIGSTGKVADQNTAITTSVEPTNLSMRALLFGNVAWNDTVDETAQKSIDKEKYVFERADSLGRTNYDIWLGSLGCGISGSVSGKTDCKPSYLKETKKWFSGLAMSNSRVSLDNAEYTSYKDLDTAGIGHFGSSTTATTDNICKVFAMPARYKLKDNTFKSASLPIALCAVNYIDSTVKVDIKSVLSKYSDLMPVFAYSHSGPKQGSGAQASDIQKAVARDLIDSGADVVVGSSPSNIQPVDTYNGKLIAYSLGDFMADKLADTTTELARFGLGLGVSIDAPTDKYTAGWVELVSTCKPFTESCLAEAKTKGLRKPNYKYSYNMAVVDTNGAQPKKADTRDFDKVAHAIGWNTLDLPGMVKN
jgi:Bacterial capsule synthesis protein PGA_cap